MDRKTSKAALKGIGLALCVVAYIGLEWSRKEAHPELARWEGKTWATQCTGPEGRTWRLEGYPYLNAQDYTERMTQRGLRVVDPEGEAYKTHGFRHKALARDGVWRWRTKPRGTGISTKGYAALPVETEWVEVLADRRRVRWIEADGHAHEWACRPEAGG